MVHVAWGLSKDFGMAGLRFGWLATHNDDLIASLLAANAGQSMVPTMIQSAVATVLSNTSAIQSLLDNSARRMRQNVMMVAGAPLLLSMLHCASSGIHTGNLTDMGIPFINGQSGLMMWVDLRDSLPNATWQGEQQLQQMLAKQQVVLAPGADFGASEPGFFRMGLGSDTTQGLSNAMTKFANALNLN